jgi:hypothetical protein
MQSGDNNIQGNLIISRENLLKIIAQFLKTNLGFEQPHFKAQSLIDQLRTRNFILCHLGDDNYGFVHRTFLEYFCACEIVNHFEKQRTLTEEDLKKGIFGKHWKDKSWHETLRLLIGMLGETIASSMLEYLIEQTDETNSSVNLVLAAQCLSEVRFRVQLHQTSVKILSLLQQATSHDLTPDVASTVVAAIAQVWRFEPNTVVWLKSRALQGGELFVKQASVQMVAKFWKDESSTLLWLKAIVQSNQDYQIRLTAMYEISDRWKAKPETLLWLKSIVETERDSSIQIEAVKEITRSWNDPDTISWLHTLPESILTPTAKLLVRRWLYKR